MIMASSYLVYAAASVLLTLWVGRALKRHGAVLISGGAEKAIATALSDLLAMGFYLFHIGFALLILRYGTRAANLPGAIETVSTKIGLVLLVLALSHFIHMAIFSKLRPKQMDVEPRLPRREEPLSAEMVR